MLARVLSAAINGIEAFPVEVEVNSGWGDTTVVTMETIPPQQSIFLTWQVGALNCARHRDRRRTITWREQAQNRKTIAVHRHRLRVERGMPIGVRSALKAGEPCAL